MAYQKVRSDVQDMVDEYIRLHAEIKALQSRQKELREVIEPYMDSKGLDFIEGTEGGKIEFVPQDRSIITSRYTTYDLHVVLPLIPEEIRGQVVVEVVDKDALELMVKTGKVPEKVREFKVTKPVRNFTVRHV